MKYTIIFLIIVALINSISVIHQAHTTHPNKLKEISIFKGANKTSFIKPFDYYVFCPHPRSSNKDSDFYQISAISQISKNGIKKQTFLYYCGYARYVTQSKDKCKITCTYPAPAFNLQRNRKIRVQWINQIQQIAQDSENTVFNPVNCNPTTTKSTCFVQGFPQNASQKLNHCDPTHPNQKLIQKYRISTKFVPITTHVHGLEIPPRYDGNPNSWFTKNGTIGIGFQRQDRSGKNAVTYIYDNTQIPGTLWYHDHAMHATKHNVYNGLVGIYLIREKRVQKQLPSGNFQKFFIFGRYRTQGGMPSVPTANTNPNLLIPARGYHSFTRDVYRFRLLNAEYTTYYPNIYFRVTYYHKSNNSITRGPKINFTVIGTDSALTSNPQYNVSQFSLGSAERIDILIDLNSPSIITTDSISSNLTLLSLNDANAQVQYVTIPIKSTRQKHNIDINKITLPYIGSSSVLKNITPKLNRYRHVLSISGALAINSHPIFYNGASDNPLIGQVQDWYIINLVNINHPIHIHLINYRIISRYALKNIINTPLACSTYSVALFNLPADLIGCTQLLTKLNINNTKNLFFENQTNSVPSIWKGCQQFQKHNGDQSDPIYNNAKKGINTCQFINSPLSLPLPNWAKFWKQTAIVEGLGVLRLRIRWARTDYQKDKHGDEFFSYTNKQLSSYPGFVYHCHFLQHEDNEMMRPIMVRDKNSNKCYY